MDNNKKILSSYADLMNEIKIRISHINVAITGELNLPVILVNEFCFLQLRMICETIALACLVAHGDLDGTKGHNISNEYSADKILKRLAELRPNSYPLPRKQVQVCQGKFNLEPVAEGFLTKQDLARLYGQSGAVLHRGSLKNLLKQNNTVQLRFSIISEWRDKIIALLNHHLIQLREGQTMIACIMQSEGLGGDVQVTFFEAVK